MNYSSKDVGSDGEIRRPEQWADCSGTVVHVFQTLEELRFLGPPAVREMLKRRRPARVGLGLVREILVLGHASGSGEKDG